jgi:hypothetical protein
MATPRHPALLYVLRPEPALEGAARPEHCHLLKHGLGAGACIWHVHLLPFRHGGQLCSSALMMEEVVMLFFEASAEAHGKQRSSSIWAGSATRRTLTLASQVGIALCLGADWRGLHVLNAAHTQP